VHGRHRLADDVEDVVRQQPDHSAPVVEARLGEERSDLDADAELLEQLAPQRRLREPLVGLGFTPEFGHGMAHAFRALTDQRR
jgi:hypothetical protein